MTELTREQILPLLVKTARPAGDILDALQGNGYSTNMVDLIACLRSMVGMGYLIQHTDMAGVTRYKALPSPKY